MKNQRGVISVIAVLAIVLAGVIAFFVPNPVSSSFGIGIRPNKTVSVQKDEILPNPAYINRHTESDQEIQQHVGFWEWLRSLPILVIILMGLGIVSPPVALFLHNSWSTLKTDTQKIVLSVDKGLAVLKAKDPALHQAVLSEMADTQSKPSSAEVVVNKAQVGQL